jgi:uncharacterized protein YcfL
MKLALGFVIALLLGGCVSVTDQGPVRYTSHTLGQSFLIQEERSWVEPNGFTTILVVAENKWSITRKLRYRTLWFTASGKPVKTSMSQWQNRTVPPRGLLEISAIAPRAEATSYRVEIDGV